MSLSSTSWPATSERAEVDRSGDEVLRLGAVSSAILLGISLIYGVCGSLNLMDIDRAMSTSSRTMR
jgi:NADH:ubiquinone oxidoreductase subunit 2 (subunit N)